MATGVVMAQI